MTGGATIDATGCYRYSLWREWDANGPRVAFVLLNPSTADAQRDDPTVRRCIGLARVWGCGSLEVVNLFAYRATNPRVLREVADPVGPENDRYLLAAAHRAQKIVPAWGARGGLHGRDRVVLALLGGGGELVCLGTTRCGRPRHPLYVSSATVPIPYRSGRWRDR
jgi:hypothetical protein